MNENANVNGQQQAQTNAAQQPENNTPNAQSGADNAAKPAENPAPTVAKDVYDKKVSELNKLNKELKAMLESKMSDEEKAAQAQKDKDAELAALRDEVTKIKTTSAFLAAGIAEEQANELSAAVVSGKTDDIISAFSQVIASVKEKTAIEVKQEILKDGSPDVNVGGNVKTEDRNLELAKSMFKNTVSKPLSESKWVK